MLQPRIWLLGLFPFRPIIPIGCRPAPAECGLDRPATRATDRRRTRCVVTIGHPTGGCRRSPRTSTARLANRFRATRLARNSPIGNPQTDSNVRLYPLDHWAGRQPIGMIGLNGNRPSSQTRGASERHDMRAEQLLGHDFASAQALGLAHDWAAKVIAATGNYGEIFQRVRRGCPTIWIVV